VRELLSVILQGTVNSLLFKNKAVHITLQYSASLMPILVSVLHSITAATPTEVSCGYFASTEAPSLKIALPV